MKERTPEDEQAPQAKQRKALKPDLIFHREEPPIPTRLHAVNPGSGQAIIAQRLGQSGEDIYSIVSVDHSWEPQPLKGEEDAARAMRMTQMIPTEKENEEPVTYSSQGEAIEEFRQAFLRVNPPPVDVDIEDIIDMFPEDLQERYWEWKRQQETSQE